MSLPLDFKRSGGWIVPVTLLSIVLGMLIAAALKTQENIRESNAPSSRYSGVLKAYFDEKARNAVLEKRIAEIQSKLDTISNAGNQGDAKFKLLIEDKRKSDMLAGLVPVEGQGVEVVLQDYPGKPPKDTPALLRDQYIVHDVDLRDVVNELYTNGAEAVSIMSQDNEQRLIASSSIRCVGGTIQINKIDMSSPFTIRAVGPSNALQKGLTMTGGLVDNWRPIAGLSSRMIAVKRKDSLVIPAYTGDISSLYVFGQGKEKSH